MNRAMVLICLFITIIGVNADELSTTMEKLGFVEAEPPEPNSTEWQSSNRGQGFIVENKGGLDIRLLPRKGRRKPDLMFDAGPVKYIGVDHGEFGGGLYIDSVKKGERPFFRGNIRALVPIKNDLYIFEGLAHMGSNRGSVHAIRDCKTPSRPERITLLPDAPRAILVRDIGKKKLIVIVGHNSFMTLTLDNDFQLIHNNAFWGSLYPTSITRFEKYYIFGIRGGIVATTASPWTKNRIRYFKPNT